MYHLEKKKKTIEAMLTGKGADITFKLQTSVHKEVEKLLLVEWTEKQLVGDSVNDIII